MLFSPFWLFFTLYQKNGGILGNCGAKGNFYVAKRVYINDMLDKVMKKISTPSFFKGFTINFP